MRVCAIKRGLADRAAFLPEQVAEVKAVACEPPAKGAPLSRRSVADVHRLVIERDICDPSVSTAEDAIRPWLYRSWIADLPDRPGLRGQGRPHPGPVCGPLGGRDAAPGRPGHLADEKPSIQARQRIYETLAPAAGVARGQRVEHTYKRGGALTYLAAWDVRRGHAFGRCERKGEIAPFDRLVHQVMTKEPYASARRVFWIVDNGSSHRGQSSIDRLQGRWPNLILVHTPVHASWQNQIEIYFSIVQRKILAPNDFDSLAQVARRLNDFEHHYNQIAEPFDWRFTRAKLDELLARLADHDQHQFATAA